MLRSASCGDRANQTLSGRHGQKLQIGRFGRLGRNTSLQWKSSGCIIHCKCEPEHSGGFPQIDSVVEHLEQLQLTAVGLRGDMSHMTAQAATGTQREASLKQFMQGTCSFLVTSLDQCDRKYQFPLPNLFWRL